MRRSDNPYRVKRKKWIKAYLILSLAPFAVYMALAFLYEATDWKLIYDIMMAVLLVDSLAMVALIPFVAYMVYLGMKARELEKGTAPQKLRTRAEDDYDLQRRLAPDQKKRMYSVPSYNGAPRLKRSKKQYGDWWACLFFLFMLPPLGLYFSCRKAATEPENYLDSAPRLISTGAVLSAVSLVPTVFIVRAALTDYEMRPFLFYGPMWLVCSFITMCYGLYIRKKGRFIALCQNFIWVDAILSLDTLSEKLHLRYGQAIRRIQRAIDQGFLFNCFIDYRGRRIVAPVQYPKIAVKCPHCGGTTVKISGVRAVCSYCGRTLRG